MKINKILMLVLGFTETIFASQKPMWSIVAEDSGQEICKQEKPAENFDKGKFYDQIKQTIVNDRKNNIKKIEFFIREIDFKNNFTPKDILNLDQLTLRLKEIEYENSDLSNVETIKTLCLDGEDKVTGQIDLPGHTFFGIPNLLVFSEVQKILNENKSKYDEKCDLKIKKYCTALIKPKIFNGKEIHSTTGYQIIENPIVFLDLEKFKYHLCNDNGQTILGIIKDPEQYLPPQKDLEDKKVDNNTTIEEDTNQSGKNKTIKIIGFIIISVIGIGYLFKTGKLDRWLPSKNQ